MTPPATLIPELDLMLAMGRCHVGKVRPAYSKAVKKGGVSSQKPKFGAVLWGGSRVNVVVSKGRR